MSGDLIGSGWPAGSCCCPSLLLLLLPLAVAFRLDVQLDVLDSRPEPSLAFAQIARRLVGLAQCVIDGL